MGAVIAVAGKAVQLPDKNYIKKALGAVFYHALEVGTVICLGRQSGVNVTADNRQGNSI